MKRRAIVLTLSRDVRELEELAFSLGCTIVGTVFQNRSGPDPERFLGRGKLDEAIAVARDLDAELVLVNGQLKPAQVFNLVKAFRFPSGDERDVMDRTRLILEIFKERAHSQEARLQVELARLRYELPLVKESIHLLRHGERAGFLGGGAYEVDQYQDMIKKRMVRITAELARLSRERDVRRKHRRRGGFDLVSLAGYTNAGKSSLLQVLAQERTLVENRYFSTLGTTTRRIQQRPGSRRKDILVTDTVGFIEDLPPWLIEAFHSTLEEIALADLILLAVDVSDPLAELRRKLKSSLHILWEFQAPRGTPDLQRIVTPLLVVFTKADLVDDGERAARIGSLVADGLVDENHVVVSATTGEGVGELLRSIENHLPRHAHVEVEIPPSPERERIVHRLRSTSSEIEELNPSPGSPPDVLRWAVTCRYEELAPILAAVDASGGRWRNRNVDRVPGATDPIQRVEAYGPSKAVMSKASSSAGLESGSRPRPSDTSPEENEDASVG
ncbi:MAG: GTPase HflX [Thermoplasmatota archaeon]